MGHRPFVVFKGWERCGRSREALPLGLFHLRLPRRKRGWPTFAVLIFAKVGRMNLRGGIGLAS